MRLTELRPEWICPGRRFGLGVVFDCLAHGPDCRLVLFFINPLDQTPQVDTDEDDRLYARDPWTARLENLSLLEPVCIPGHWEGRLVNGVLYPDPRWTASKQ